MNKLEKLVWHDLINYTYFLTCIFFQAKGSYWWMVKLQKQKQNSQNCQSPGRKMKESQRVEREPNDIRSRKYSSSHNRQHCKDKRIYQAFLSGESGGKFCKTISLWSSLLHQEGTLYCPITKLFFWKILMKEF